MDSTNAKNPGDAWRLRTPLDCDRRKTGGRAHWRTSMPTGTPTSVEESPEASSDLYFEILTLLVDDPKLTDRERTLIDGALRGDADFSAVLAEPSKAPPLRERSQEERGPRPPRVFLEQISVQGFRGADEQATLQLRPGPGLTLVVGRNGTGKSTFVDAVETLLTGTTERWEDRKAYKLGWKNIGTSLPPLISCAFLAEGIGRCEARRTWASAAALAEGVVSFSDHSGAEQTFDWKSACASERPFLGYRRLATVVEDPSSVFDALHGVLGLELFDVASGRLDEAISQYNAQLKEVDRKKEAATAALAASSHPVSPALLALAEAKKPDLQAIQVSLNGVVESRGDDEPDLRSIGRANLPTASEWENARAELDAAIEHCAAKREESLAGGRELLHVLEVALPLFSAAPQACPVCQTELSDVQVEGIRARADALRKASGAHHDAETALKELHQQAVRLASRLCATPQALIEQAQPALSPTELATVSRTVNATPEEAVRALVGYAPHLGALHRAQSLASEELERRGADLKRVTGPVQAWLSGAQDLAARKPVVKELKQAKKWLKSTAESMREKRFAPLEEATVSNWKTLGADTSVALSGVKLAGSRTQRKIDLQVQIDGKDAPGAAVLSQGEVNCMALSLFLPRAISQDGPFRFVLIDDPVQAMDQVRVSGLAQVLQRAAEELQVVVFTHDTRLVGAVRRHQIPATVLEVQRRANSRLEVKEFVAPHIRYLKDANAVVYSDGTGDELPRRVVPGFCQLAVEAAAQEVIYRNRLGSGATYEEIEELLSDRTNLLSLVAFALFDDPARGGEVASYFKKKGATRELDALFKMKQTHGSSAAGAQIALKDLIRDTKEVCRIILGEG
ncbi:MAG: AAA family ATPase [Polyangiaceae bacterium]